MSRSRLRLAAAFALVGLTVACSPTADPSARTSAADQIELVYTYDSELGQPLKEVLGTMKEGPKVTLTVAGDSYEDVLTRLAADRTAGKLPDIAMIGLDTARTVADAGLAVPLDEFLKADPTIKVSELAPAAVNAVTFDGSMYGMPCMGTASPILYYNADVFTAAGLNPAAPPATWSEVISASEKIKASGAAEYGIFYTPNSYLFQSALFSNGGALMDDDRKTLELDSPQAGAVLRYYQDLAKKGLMPAVPDPAGRDTFLQGRTAMLVTSSSSVANLSSNTNFDLRTGYFPIPDNGQRKPVMSGNTFMIVTQDPARQRAAWQVLAHMCSADSSAAFAVDTGYIPFNVGAREPAKAKQPIRNAGYDQTENLTPWFNFPGDNAVQITTAINEMVESAVAGNDVAQALSDASHKIDGLLP